MKNEEKLLNRICNQQVAGSNPIASSMKIKASRVLARKPFCFKRRFVPTLSPLGTKDFQTMSRVLLGFCMVLPWIVDKSGNPDVHLWSLALALVGAVLMIRPVGKFLAGLVAWR